jgi:putative RNA 2'-phosphotransferase
MGYLDFIQLSKVVSHALRHEPQSYNLELDSDGWVLLSDLVSSLKRKDIVVTNDTIMQMVEQSEKKRHQILNGKIRANYGHSTNEKIIKASSEPPDVLYHGTLVVNLTNIFDNGILAMKRQYVHLSTDEDAAKLVASRRQGALVVIKVKAQKAFKNNISFYKEENGIWLSECIPAKYIYL